MELGLEISTEDKVVELLGNIIKCPFFKADSVFCKGVLENIIHEKKETGGRGTRRRETETIVKTKGLNA